MPAFNYPIFLDVSTRPIVIVGGGAVAARKAKALLEAGATNVTAVSPAFHRDFPAGVTRVSAEYDEKYLDDAGLVFAATNSADVNAAVLRDARKRAVLVNRADDGEMAGDFATVATHRDGSITVAVSAGGNPAVAAAVRDEIAEKLDARWAALNEVGRELRETLPTAKRATALRRLASKSAMDEYAIGGIDRLREWLSVRNDEEVLPQINTDFHR